MYNSTLPFIDKFLVVEEPSVNPEATNADNGDMENSANQNEAGKSTY